MPFEDMLERQAMQTQAKRSQRAGSVPDVRPGVQQQTDSEFIFRQNARFLDVTGEWFLGAGTISNMHT